MMKVATLRRFLAVGLIWIGGALPAIGGSNLVPNPSFDSPKICPTGISQLATCSPPWFSGNGATPDTHNECSSSTDAQVPKNFRGTQSVHSGTGYAGMYVYRKQGEIREYAEVKLDSPLVANQQYTISFFVSLSDQSNWAIRKMGVFFSVGPVSAPKTQMALSVTPQFVSDQGWLKEKDGWTQVTGKFVATGGEDHITIGNFDRDSIIDTKRVAVHLDSDFAYYYLDDVSLTCDCTSPPVITQQPTSQTVPCGQGTSFTSGASAPCISGFEWICDDCTPDTTRLPANSNYFSGTMTPTLTLTPLAVETYKGKTFRMTAFNDCSTAFSQGASVTPVLPPMLQQPSDVTICPPQTTSFSVIGTGTGWKYQWYWEMPGSTPVPFDLYQGGTSSMLSFDAWPGLCGAKVYCVLSNACGSVTSSAATVHCCDCTPPPTNMALWLPFDQVSSPGATRNVISGYGGVLWPLGTGPAPVNGWFAGNSLWFDGASQYVTVQSHDLVDITTGDFSIDAWIFVEGASANEAVVVEKSVTQGSAIRGYSLSLQKSSASYGYDLRFQLADGTASSWQTTLAAPIASGWRHVAVTVERKSTSGGRFYLDGSLVGTFNPAARQGSLSNTRPFTVGSHSTTPSGFFFGAIDEVELFRRALAPTEVAALFNAKSSGKCKQFVQAYPDTIYCENSTSTTIGAYLFNFTPNATTFTGSFQPLKVSPFFPFAPTNLPVFPPPTVVGPWGTQPVWTSATKPPGMGSGAIATYLTPFTASSGKSSTALGRIVNRPDIYCSTGPATLVQAVPLGGTSTVRLSFGNAGIPSGSLSYKVVAVGPDGLLSQTLSLNGMPPGESLEGSAPTQIGADFEVLVDASFREVDALGLTMLVLLTDADDDGVFEFASSAPLLCDVPDPPSCCPADFNCDGQVDDADFSVFVAAYDELICPDAPAVCPPDFNFDGFVDDADFQVFLLAYSGVLCIGVGN